MSLKHETVARRMARGLTRQEVWLLGKVPSGVLHRGDIVKASRLSGVAPEILLYRVAIMGWTLARAEAHGGRAHPPAPVDEQFIWEECIAPVERSRPVPTPPGPHRKNAGAKAGGIQRGFLR